MNVIDVKVAGKMGGEVTLKKYGTSHFKKLSEIGNKARWGKRNSLLDNTKRSVYTSINDK